MEFISFLDKGLNTKISVNLDLKAGVNSFFPQSPDGFIAAIITKVL